MIGASGLAIPTAGEWQINVAARTLRSDRHYRLDEEQVERHENQTYVINRQNLLDIGVTYAPTERVSLSVGVPFVVSSWSIPTPFGPPPGPRAEQNGSGLGDITATTRYMLFDPRRYTRGNVVIGGGVKLPTGKSDVEDTYPDLRTGLNEMPKTVDMSIQPGDGGWGILADVQAYQQLGRALIFGSGTYLANPRDTNDAPSIIVGLGVATPANADRHLNSVPDQYLLRAGGLVPLGIPGLSGSLSWRMEGLRRYDLLGDSHGFRRPGYELFIEPGIHFTHGRSQWVITVPIGYHRRRQPDPYTGALGDATFPDYVFLGGYSYRFGKRAPAPPASAPGPTTATPPGACP